MKIIEEMAHDVVDRWMLKSDTTTPALVADIAAALREMREECVKVLLDPSMREQYVMQGPRCLVTAAARIRELGEPE